MPLAQALVSTPSSISCGELPNIIALKLAKSPSLATMDSLTAPIPLLSARLLLLITALEIVWVEVLAIRLSVSVMLVIKVLIAVSRFLLQSVLFPLKWLAKERFQ